MPEGQSRGIQTLLPGFTIAKESPRTWHGAGSCGAAPRRITYSFNHHFPSACCVPGLEPEGKDTEMHRAVPARGQEGRFTETLSMSQRAAKRKVLSVHSVYVSTVEGTGESLPLTFRTTSPQEA